MLFRSGRTSEPPSTSAGAPRQQQSPEGHPFLFDSRGPPEGLDEARATRASSRRAWACALGRLDTTPPAGVPRPRQMTPPRLKQGLSPRPRSGPPGEFGTAPRAHPRALRVEGPGLSGGKWRQLKVGATGPPTPAWPACRATHKVQQTDPCTPCGQHSQEDPHTCGRLSKEGP